MTLHRHTTAGESVVAALGFATVLLPLGLLTVAVVDALQRVVATPLSMHSTWLPALWGTARLVGVGVALSLVMSMAMVMALESTHQSNAQRQLMKGMQVFLSGVPPVLYGVLMAVMVFGGLRGVSTQTLGAMSVAMVLCPSLVATVRRALRSVPEDEWAAAHALGGTPVMVLAVVLGPRAIVVLAVGVLRAVGQAIGLCAPLVLLWAWWMPEGLHALPLVVWDALTVSAEGGASLAAAGVLMLVGSTWLVNGMALAVNRGWDVDGQ